MKKRIVAGIIAAFILAFAFTFLHVERVFVNKVTDFIVPIFGRSINPIGEELGLVDFTVKTVWGENGSHWVIDRSIYRAIRSIAASIIETWEVAVCFSTFLLVSKYDKLPFLSKHYATIKRDN